MENLKLHFEGIGTVKEDPKEARETLINGTGAGADFTGWVMLPRDYDKAEFAAIKEAAAEIRENSKVLVVCGIGGSYLGAAAAIEFLRGAMANSKPGNLEIYFAGNNMAPAYIADIVDAVKDKDFSVNVISKSGTTMETSISFRIFKKILEDKYGKEAAAKRIYATTDKARGALKELSTKEGYRTYVVPDNVGGRYSVLTAVGLLPIAAAGGDIDALMAGAEGMRKYLTETARESNQALDYAATRQHLYKQGKVIEIFANYDPDLRLFGEWLKQLFGESEGKDEKGIFPASVNLTSDLHSMGQMIQDGERNIFETVINVEKPLRDIEIPAFDDDFDGFGYLEGKGVSLLNETAVKGTAKAHLDGGVPQIRVDVKDRSEKSLGELFYFFEFVCGVSAYLEGVNPFDQPGVEEYKKNIKALLAQYK